MVNKKITSEIAVGIVLLLALIIGGAFWMMGNNKEKKIETPKSNESVTTKNNDQKIDSQKSVLSQIDNGWWIHQDKAIGINFNYPNKLEIEKTGWNSDGEIFYSWKNGEYMLSTEKIEYDNNYADRGDMYEPNQFSSESARKIFINASCDELSKIIANFSYDDKYKTLLPSSFKKPNICGYSKENGVIKFYVIGVRNDTEGTPWMGSDIVVLTDKYAILMSDVLNIESIVPKAEQYKKDHPNIEFASKEDLALREIYVNGLSDQVKNSDSKLKQEFNTLSEIAKSITIEK